MYHVPHMQSVVLRDLTGLMQSTCASASSSKLRRRTSRRIQCKIYPCMCTEMSQHWSKPSLTLYCQAAARTLQDSSNSQNHKSRRASSTTRHTASSEDDMIRYDTIRWAVMLAREDLGAQNTRRPGCARRDVHDDTAQPIVYEEYKNNS